MNEYEEAHGNLQGVERDLDEEPVRLAHEYEHEQGDSR
jgi:hypothetical protein